MNHREQIARELAGIVNFQNEKLAFLARTRKLTSDARAEIIVHRQDAYAEAQMLWLDLSPYLKKQTPHSSKGTYRNGR